MINIIWEQEEDVKLKATKKAVDKVHDSTEWLKLVYI